MGKTACTINFWTFAFGQREPELAGEAKTMARAVKIDETRRRTNDDFPAAETGDLRTLGLCATGRNPRARYRQQARFPPLLFWEFPFH